MDTWADSVREMALRALLRGRRVIDDVLCNEAEKCSQDQEWIDIMENMVGWISTPSYTLEM